jgi:hypothetical protein
MARPYKYNQDVHNKLVIALELGVSRTAACGLARIDVKTFRNWLDRGRAGEEKYLKLLHDVEHAEATVEQEMVHCVYKAAKRHDHRAATWWLERRNRKEWDPKHEQVSDNKPTVVNIAVSGPSKVTVDPEDTE